LNAGPDPRRKAVNATEIARENSSRETVTRLISKPPRFILIFKGGDGEHRAEQLGLYD